MAKALNSYVKYLISEHEPIVKLIHQHGGKELDRLTDDEIDLALNQPYNKLVRESLRSLFYYIRTHAILINTQESTQVLLNYLTEAMPIIEINRDQLFGEPRALLGELHDKLNEQFKEIVTLNYDSKYALSILEENYANLELIGNTTFQNNFEFRSLILEEISRELDKQGISLSEAEKAEFLEDISWAELIKIIQKNNIPTPANVNLAKPDYSTYFELKRCIAIANHQKQHGGKINAINDTIHPDIIRKIQSECSIDDAVTELIFSQFNQYCLNTKSKSLDLSKIIEEKKSLLLDLNQQAMELATVEIPDSKPLKKIAKETIAKDINLQLPSAVKSVPTVKLG